MTRTIDKVANDALQGAKIVVPDAILVSHNGSYDLRLQGHHLKISRHSDGEVYIRGFTPSVPDQIRRWIALTLIGQKKYIKYDKDAGVLKVYDHLLKNGTGRVNPPSYLSK